MTKILPSQKYLNKLFLYNDKTGVLIRKSGRKTGCKLNTGYIKIRIDGVPYVAHRIIWKMVYGYDPLYIDHINHNKSDNRICNLREVTKSQNQRNKPMQENNSSGCVGVYWNTRKNKWVAQMMLGKRNLYIGAFKDKKSAIAARKQKEFELGFHKNHGKK